ncbi:PTS sugar transporter subunit IIA [Clostridium sp.]|uniref:BglG family transcription antiterminator n=1 Tax=Clostridium sp. TaxID=1506 RepID=UPI002603AF2E|nr:PTS sugar transporter subunit IIA [Clostridium sp.]
MKDLTPRQQFILNELLNEGSLEIKNLQKQFDISDKTIYREVTAINKCLSRHSINVFNSYNLELIISGKKEIIEKLRKESIKVPVQWVLNKNQRQIMILTELLLTKEPIKATYFKSKYNVAMASISFDLDYIEEWAIKKNLFLARKKSYGIELEGPQWNKRTALSEIFFSLKPLDELLKFFYGEEKDPSIDLIFKIAFGEKNTTLVKNILKDTKIEILNNNDVKYFEFFIQLLISIKNIEIGTTMILPDEIIEEILQSNELCEIEELNQKLILKGIELPREERAYLKLYINNYDYYNENPVNNVGININSVVKEFIEEISNKVNVNLNSDEQLINNLNQHFNQSINVLNIGLRIINPLLKEIKDHNEELFEAVSSICKRIFSRYSINIPDDEVGYITLHIDVAIKKYQYESIKIKTLIICPTGMSTAKILSNRVKGAFSEIEVVEIGSVFDWKNLGQNNKYDLIISTFNLSENSKRLTDKENIITVSPFLTIKDIGEINEFIYKFNKEKNNLTIIEEKEEVDKDIKEYENEIAENLLKRFTLKHSKAKTLEELITYIARDVEEAGLTENKEEIERLILDREKKGNVVIPRSGIALLHTRSDEMKVPFIGVYRLEKGIPMASIGFSMEEVSTFFVMLARASNENEALKYLGKISIALIENKDFTDKLKSADVESNIDIIKTIIYTREE